MTETTRSRRLLAAWLALAPGRPFHVEVDTGMARWGLGWESFGAAAAERFRMSPTRYVVRSDTP